MENTKIEIRFEILEVLKNMLILSSVKQKFMSPILLPSVTEFLHYTKKVLALTLVKHIPFCLLDDVT